MRLDGNVVRVFSPLLRVTGNSDAGRLGRSEEGAAAAPSPLASAPASASAAAPVSAPGLKSAGAVVVTVGSRGESGGGPALVAGAAADAER